MDVNLAIIICTRNRADSLELILKSISQSIIKPAQIILVSSGNDVSNIVSLFNQKLNLLHKHTDKVGQSNQKIIGIGLLESKIEWVFFLDDDLLLLPNTLNYAIKKINEIGDTNIVGIGTQIIASNVRTNKDFFQKTKFFKKKMGKILTSGRATSYQNSITFYTEWLNGASIWNKEVLVEYKLPILNSRYAAYEDVIFSTRVNKSHKLIYDPEIKIVEQLQSSEVQLNSSVFSYINLWTGYFVCTDTRTKVSHFKVLVIFRFLKFCIQKSRFRNQNLKDIVESAILTSKLIMLPNNKTKANQMIQVLIQDEIHKNI